MPKRFRVQHAKPGQLKAYYGKADRWDGPDVCFASGPGCDRSDRRVLHGALSQEFTDELVSRGYDITTLRFSIMLKPAT